MVDVSALNTFKQMWKLTWVRQDGVSLRQKLVTADSLVAFSTPGGEKKKKKHKNKPSVMKSICQGTNATTTDVNAKAAHKLPPHVLRQM